MFSISSMFYEDSKSIGEPTLRYSKVGIETFFMHFHDDGENNIHFPKLSYINKYANKITMAAEAAEFILGMDWQCDEHTTTNDNHTEAQWNSLQVMYEATIACTEEGGFPNVMKSQLSDLII